MNNPGTQDFISVVKTIPDLDAEYAIGAIGGYIELYEKILKKVIQLLPSNIAHMDANIGEGGDLWLFAVKAHGVKGSFNQIGAFKLAKTAELLEKAAKDENRTYCEKHYRAFRDEAMRFHGLLSEAVPQDIKANAESNGTSDIDSKALLDALLRAGKAAADFDTPQASKILAPLALVHFDSNTDLMISQAVEALDVFKPVKASAIIDALLKEYERSDPANKGGKSMSRSLKKILAVDDSAANLTLINGILNGLYKIYPVNSGADALEFLEMQYPDMVLLDVEMPEMSGVELFHIIKSNPKLRDIPVIFLTGNTSQESEAEAFRIGVDDYIRKPVNDVILLARVKLHLELASFRKEKE